MKKDKYITVALDEELYNYIIERSNNEDRTPSSLVRLIIKNEKNKRLKNIISGQLSLLEKKIKQLEKLPPDSPSIRSDIVELSYNIDNAINLLELESKDGRYN